MVGRVVLVRVLTVATCPKSELSVIQDKSSGSDKIRKCLGSGTRGNAWSPESGSL